MESSIANNPLAKHFRQPSIYLKLPSGGQFYPEGSVEIGVTGEIPVYPMTVKDELLIRTPDALMNGDSMAQMIKSCCPAIKDPWSIPMIDLDAVLIAIRIASYGNELEVDSKCTHCEADNEHNVDLRVVLDSIKSSDRYDKSYIIDGLDFKLQPQQYKEINTIGLINFEQRKLVSAIDNSDLSAEEKKAYFDEAFKKLTDLNISTLISCIKSITTEEGIVVTESAMIKEFMLNANRSVYEEVRDIINGTLEEQKIKPMQVPCNECSKEYKVNVDFNQTNFFE